MPKPSDAIAVARLEAMELLAAINAHVDAHFEVLPETANWGDAGDAKWIVARLRDITDRIRGTDC